MTGRVAIIGLGPGDDRYLTREASDALESADTLFGYGPYLDRVPARVGQTRHGSDAMVDVYDREWMPLTKENSVWKLGL